MNLLEGPAYREKGALAVFSPSSSPSLLRGLSPDFSLRFRWQEIIRTGAR
jgi:hypothetical protein